MIENTIAISSFTLLDPLAERLQQVEALLAAQVDASSSPFVAALGSLIASGGKRLRPRIALLSGGALGADPALLVNLAAAIEMLHTATLIHDDLVDGAEVRRGVQTLNARWSAAASVLVGDLAFTRAAELILGTRTFPAVEMFIHTMSRMVDGEVTQLSRVQGILNREDYFRWIAAKTAALFELSAGGPALLSAAGEDVFVAARRFGYGIGMAFQIVDDVLDYTGDPARLGKPVGSDLRQGVITLPALLYLEDNPHDLDLQAVIHRQGLGDAVQQGLIGRIRRSPAIERSLEMAQGFVRDALDDLAYLPESSERFALEDIARDILTRNK